MPTVIRLLTLLLLSASFVRGAEPAAKQFLRYTYGAGGIELTNICHPSADVWMLRWPKKSNALAALDGIEIAAKPTGVVSGLVGTDLYFVETRDGKVDPALNLDGVYLAHRQLILGFIYSALSKNTPMLNRMVTDMSKVEINGPPAASGDMDQYGSIIEQLPVVRSSKPVDDAKRLAVTYRVPLGDDLLFVTLIKDGNTWKIDTSKQLRVSFKFFYR